MQLTVALEKRDIEKINKLNKLHNYITFYDDVRKLTRNVHSEHSLHRWQILADMRYEEIKPYNPTKEDIRNRIINACDNGVFVYKGEIYDDVNHESIDYLPSLTYWVDRFVPFGDEEEISVWIQTDLFDYVNEIYSPLGDDVVYRKFLKAVKKYLLNHLELNLC